MLCAKSTLFRCPGRLWKSGFQYHKGENLFCFLFSDPINTTGRKTIRKISVPTLIIYEIRHIAFTHAFMVTCRSPSG